MNAWISKYHNHLHYINLIKSTKKNHIAFMQNHRPYFIIIKAQKKKSLIRISSISSPLNKK